MLRLLTSLHAQLARLGVDVFCRQQISADGYGLLDKALVPHPDFFTAVLYKRLVGATVLNTSVTDNGNPQESYVRIYAHCSRTPTAGVALVFLNLLGEAVSVRLPAAMAEGPRKEWHLTAPALSSKVMSLNGVPLQLVNEQLPPFPSRSMPSSDRLLIGPYSYGFAVVEKALGVCAR